MKCCSVLTLTSACCPVPSPDLSFQPDEHLEVYVSASENPNHFWIQILGVRSLLLDKLTEEMNHFYNNSSATVSTGTTPTSISLLPWYYRVLCLTSVFYYHSLTFSQSSVQTLSATLVCGTAMWQPRFCLKI